MLAQVADVVTISRLLHCGCRGVDIRVLKEDSKSAAAEKQKGREPVAPFIEAPQRACVENAPSRADWRVLGRGLYK